MEDIKKDKGKTSGIVGNGDDNRIIVLSGTINESITKEVIERLLELQGKSPMEEITLIIDSYGGDVDSMFAITDLMDIIIPDIKTVCIGKAMSASAFIFICGTKGKRLMTKTSRLMLHQLSGFTYGSLKDMDIQVKEARSLQEEMIKIISERSLLDIDSIKDLMDRDRYIRPDDAIEMGLCDGIITKLS